MELIASYCLTEPGSGSDAASLRTTRAAATATTTSLNGTKAFISGAGACDLYVVMARTGGDGPGGHLAPSWSRRTRPASPSASRRRRWAGTRQPTAQVNFDDCRVPVEQPHRRRGRGLPDRHGGPGRRAGQHRRLLAGRPPAPASSGALAYVQGAAPVRPPAGRVPGLQFELADMATELEAARLMVRRAASRSTAGARRHPGLRHGQALRHRRRLPGRQRRPCSSTAATATCTTTRWSATCATCACTRSSKGPTRSCGVIIARRLLAG